MVDQGWCAGGDAAWLGVAGFVLLAAGASGLWWWAGPTAGWSLLGAVAAVALTASPGPSRGRQLAGRWSVPIMAVAVLATMVVGTIGYHLPAMQEWGLTALVAGAVVACGPRSRVGRRAALILALPAMTFALTSVLVATAGSVAINGPTALLAIVYYCVPVLVLLALGPAPPTPTAPRPALTRAVQGLGLWRLCRASGSARGHRRGVSRARRGAARPYRISDTG